MTFRFRLALRNILRHRGRSLVALLMIAGAVVGQVVFAGFSSYVLNRMKKTIIDNQYSHIQIGRQAYWELRPGSRKTHLLGGTESLIKKIEVDPAVESASGRLSFFGLASTGEITVSAKGLGFDPGRETAFMKNLKIESGHGFDRTSHLNVLIGAGLQKKLNVKSGDTLTVLSYTLDGVVNAVDLNVDGIFRTSNSEIDENVFMLPLVAAQSLLDTDHVEVLAVRLKETGQTENEQTNLVRTRLQAIATAVDADIQAKTWYELATFFRQVESFYHTQNHIIEVILLALVFLGILNTIGMAIYERTGEIGTARALGEKKTTMIAQFTLEGALLGALGACMGAALGWALSLFISSLNLPLDLPGTSAPIPIWIDPVPSAYVRAMVVVGICAVVATWIPSFRASRMSIVEALRKNI